MITIGCCFILAAAALMLYNRGESAQAGEEADALSAQMLKMLESSEQSADSRNVDDPALGLLEVEDTEEIATMQVGEYAVCGVISIPSIAVELAVIDGWSYPKLKVSANRFYGTPDKQMMIMAHNYDRHFGRLNKLAPGDKVQFTDTQGVVHRYEVSATTLLATSQLKEIVAGEDWDLTLFTCTYGGANRVVVRCLRENQQ